MSIVLFPAIILLYIILYICIRFPPLKVHGVDVYILFLETALVFYVHFSQIVQHGDK